ncbi:MAG: histidinol-phosphatase [Lachnospiraceae bacterium]|nr:histidinol-phosphatase [Lachnospiraceae bacterium]
MKQNLHTHTVFCDGEDTPEAFVKEAIARGFDSIGFSGHGYAFFDDEYCMSREGTKAYLDTLLSLRDQYRDQIKIYIGVEQDYFSDPVSYQWDFVIGSVHNLLVDGEIYALDLGRELIEQTASEHFGGDIYSLIAEYYKLDSRVVQVTGCDIIGHFDLITKYNEDCSLFDPHHPDYVEMWSRALDSIFTGADVGSFWTGAQRTGVSSFEAPIFEINTGAMTGGYRTVPYPSIDILRSVCARGGRILFSSDSHKKESIENYFDVARDLALEAGFTEGTVLTDEGFVQIPL